MTRRRRYAVPVFAAALLAAQTAGAGEVRRLYRSLDVGEQGSVRLQAPTASVILVPAPRPGRLEIEVVLSCAGDARLCSEAAESVALASEGSPHRLDLRLSGPVNHVDIGGRVALVYQRASRQCRRRPSPAASLSLSLGPSRPAFELSAELWVGYPPGRPIEIALDQGHVVALGLSTSASIDLDEGSVSIVLSRELARSVRLEAGRAGRTRLVLPDGRAVGERRLSRWDGGGGDADVVVRVRAGDAALRLRGPE